MKEFKNYLNEIIKPHTKGLEYLNISTETADKISEDFTTFVKVDRYDRNYLLIDLGNGFAFEVEENTYRKNKFEYSAPFSSFVDVKEMFNYKGNNIFTYSKKAFEKVVNFYTSVYDKMELFESLAQFEMLNKHNELLKKGFIYIPNSSERYNYFKFGLYLSQYVKLAPKVNNINGELELIVSLDSYSSTPRIIEDDFFKDNLDDNKIVSYVEMEEYINAKDKVFKPELSLLKSDICLSIIQAITFDYKLPNFGIEFYIVDKYNRFIIHNSNKSKKYEEYEFIHTLDVQTLLDLRIELLRLLKENEPEFKIIN